MRINPVKVDAQARMVKIITRCVSEGIKPRTMQSLTHVSGCESSEVVNQALGKSFHRRGVAPKRMAEPVPPRGSAGASPSRYQRPLSLPSWLRDAGGVDAPRTPADAEVFDVDVALTRRYHQLFELQILDG